MARDGTKSGGRPKGSLNKRTEEAQFIAARLKIDPFEIMLHFAAGNWKELGYDSPQKEISIGEGQTLFVDRIDEQLRQKAAKDALPYLRPQLKSVELTGDAAESAAMNFAAMIARLDSEPEEND